MRSYKLEVFPMRRNEFKNYVTCKEEDAQVWAVIEMVRSDGEVVENAWVADFAYKSDAALFIAAMEREACHNE